jgi:hypothetical protein
LGFNPQRTVKEYKELRFLGLLATIDDMEGTIKQNYCVHAVA